MKSFLEILHYEVENRDKIHLFYRLDPDCEKRWVAYQQSAFNLAEIVPELAEDVEDRLFADGEVKLYGLAVSSEQMERYGLPLYCTLLGDDYIELQKTPVKEEAEA
ncbi:hypothetical protein [Bacteroides cellulosilyticus]|uniref:hypothetical protein n=1 Tax=Bacteroides cellulosilyticus TaxID=246787 RepID=UPI003568161A